MPPAAPTTTTTLPSTSGGETIVVTVPQGEDEFFITIQGDASVMLAPVDGTAGQLWFGGEMDPVLLTDTAAPPRPGRYPGRSDSAERSRRQTSRLDALGPDARAGASSGPHVHPASAAPPPRV